MRRILILGSVLILPLTFINTANASCAVVDNGANVCDGSTTISSGGTAQNLFAGVVPKNGYDVSNPNPSEDCWVSDTTTAAANAVGSIRLQANGGWYETPLGKEPIAAVSILCATTGHKITASRW